jgi:hypothetical protein
VYPTTLPDVPGFETTDWFAGRGDCRDLREAATLLGQL